MNVIVPFYGENSDRIVNLARVHSHLIRGGFDPFTVGGDGPGHARNRGTDHTNDPVLIFNDADTVVPPAQIREAARLAATAPGLVFAYTLYVRLDEGKPPPADGTFPAHVEVIGASGSAGCIAISRECFEEAGGFDESYVGWGYEDLEFAQRCGKLWPSRRVEGPAYHLWHGERRADDSPADSDPSEVAANLARWRLTL